MNDPTTQYARDVAGGRAVSGRLVRLACGRHLRDLVSGHERGLYFDVAEAQAAFDLWAMCPHLKGEWAARGEMLRLEPWQQFIIGSVYGWKRADGHRRFRVAWVEMGRKNAKTTTVYPAILHGLCLDGEAGAEVYSVATKKDQARLVYSLARRTAVKVPDFHGLITCYAHSMATEADFGKCEALGADADTLDGLSPSVVIADEVHKWRGRELWDVIETGMGARNQPLLWAITTAGPEDATDVYGQEHDYTRQVVEGVIEDDTRFGYLACLDDGDDWTDPANFAKANPNLGVSVRADEIARAVEKARHSPAAANAVKRLRLGIRTQDADAWLSLPIWDALADRGLTWESLAGFPCYAGLDLASTADFAAFALVFPLSADMTPAADLERPERWAYLFRLWMPQEGRSHKETKLREIAAPWLSAGEVVATSGDAIDTDTIESDIINASRYFNLIGLAYDPFNAHTLATHLAAEGIDILKFPQSMASFAEPTKAFEEDYLNGRMRHDGNKCIRWMADNVILLSNGAGHRMPSRKRSRNKIDGIVAGIMARGRAMVGGGERSSFYDTNGVEVF